jgi:protein TonB
MKLVRERIYAHWSYPYEAMRREQAGELLIDFGIAKDGKLAHVELRRSSGVHILDAYALRAVRNAHPYPTVPDSIGDKSGFLIAGTFVYHLTSPLDPRISK